MRKNYIEQESNGDRNKTVSVEEYLNKIGPYLKGIINNLKKFETWKIQLRISIGNSNKLRGETNYDVYVNSTSLVVNARKET